MKNQETNRCERQARRAELMCAAFAIALLGIAFAACGGSARESAESNDETRGSAASLKGVRVGGLNVSIQDPREESLGVHGGSGPSPAAKRENSVLVSSNEISFQEPLRLLPDGNGGISPLFLSITRGDNDSRLYAMNFVHKVMDPAGKIQMGFEGEVANYDSQTDQWYIDIAGLIKNAGLPADPASLHRIELVGETEGKSLRPVFVSFRMYLPAPALKITLADGESLPEQLNLAKSYERYPALVRREIISNLGTMDARVIVSSGDLISFRTQITTQAYAKQNTPGLVSRKLIHFQSIGHVQPVPELEDGDVEERGEDWIGFTIAKGASATVIWKLKPGAGTSICPLYAPTTHGFSWHVAPEHGGHFDKGMEHLNVVQDWKITASEASGSFQRTLRSFPKYLAFEAMLDAPINSPYLRDRVIREQPAVSSGSAFAKVAKRYPCQGVF